jgi:hypothetical protein
VSKNTPSKKRFSSNKIRALILGLLLSLVQSAHIMPAHSNYSYDGMYICATGDFPSVSDFFGTYRVVNGSNQDYITVAFLNGGQYRLYEVENFKVIDGGDCVGELILGDGITEIADNAFYVRTFGEASWQSNSRSTWFMGEVSQLTDITIPSSVTTIGSNAFRNSLLSTITFLGNAPTVGTDAFLNIPNGLTVYVSANATGFDSGVWQNFNVVSPPAFSISSNSETKSVNSAITGYTISSTGGTITSYAITPSAPAGLSFNTTTGLLTGTPTEVSAATAFTITGTNGAGSATATFTLTVTALAQPAFSISSNSETKSVNSAITGYTISSTGGTITSYAITPSAPAGLSFNTTTGLLTGTPTEVSAATAFTITGTNGAGSATATFTLTVTATNNSNSSGSGSTTTSTTAADELRRQQEAAQAAKQKQDQELKEILSLVPTIAGLAQGIAGLGNSLLLPKKCVKGKLVKNVKAEAKCPKGYKVRK